MLFFLLAMTMQLTADQEATLKAGVAEIKLMDQELHDIQENGAELQKSRTAREAEIAVLKRRYPEIVIPSGATVTQVYRALYNARIARSAKLRPLAQESMQTARASACRAAKELFATTKEVEDQGALDSMTLAERLDWRRKMDAVTAETADCPK